MESPLLSSLLSSSSFCLETVSSQFPDGVRSSDYFSDLTLRLLIALQKIVTNQLYNLTLCFFLLFLEDEPQVKIRPHLMLSLFILCIWHNNAHTLGSVMF